MQSLQLNEDGTFKETSEEPLGPGAGIPAGLKIESSWSGTWRRIGLNRFELTTEIVNGGQGFGTMQEVFVLDVLRQRLCEEGTFLCYERR